MRPRLLLALLLAGASLWSQDAALRDTFVQAKALWATQGDREAASDRFDAVVAVLAPRAGALEPAWRQVLCETYNWLAVLDDRSSQNKARAAVRLQALIDLDPDFDVDRALTSQRLAGVFDRLKAEKFAPLRLTFDPEGGSLTVDGKPAAALPKKHLPFGPHTLVYARPGYASMEVPIELAAKDAKAVAFALKRVSSTVTFQVHPPDAEVLLDGRSLGPTRGLAAPAGAGAEPQDFSAPFLIADLPAGKHRLELRAPCHRTRILTLNPDLATPQADHTLEPIRLEDARGTLSLSSPWPSGEAFLAGQSLGPLPQKGLLLCPGAYELQVRFPGGGFSKTLTVEDAKAVELEVQPRPRLAILGLAAGEFTGRARFLAQLEILGERLQRLAVLAPRPGESPAEALARLKASREAELVLTATPVLEEGVHYIELRVATLDGEEERLRVKPLEQDPLADLALRLNTLPPLGEPGLGLTLLDVPGQPGPWVLAAPEAALKAGLEVGRPILQVGGKAVATTKALRQALAGAKGTVTLSQSGPEVTLPVEAEGLELPLGAPDLCYPALLAQLRLLAIRARGDEAHLIRLNLALALMQFRRFDRAVDLLRDTRLSTTRGISQGSIDFHTGVCFLHLGPAYRAEATQAFRQALKYPQSTLLGPDGPLVAPLARQALEDPK